MYKRGCIGVTAEYTDSFDSELVEFVESLDSSNPELTGFLESLDTGGSKLSYKRFLSCE